MRISRFPLPSLAALLLSLLAPLSASCGEEGIVTLQVAGEYTKVAEGIRNAIVGKGLHVAHVAEASDMLNRTGPDFGYQDAVFGQAQIFEFCSAAISHKLVRFAPQHITLCPFTISVYTLNKSPEHVHIAYRIPRGVPGAEPITQEVVELIKGIIEEATW